MKTNPYPVVLPAEDNKTEHINIRVSRDFKRLVERQAARDRRRLTEWVRLKLADALMDKN